jgi:hypothetical protein
MQQQMIVLTYLGSQCTKCHEAGWTCRFLSRFVWSRLSDLMRLSDGANSECASNFVQISEKVQRRPWPPVQWAPEHVSLE